PDVAAPLPAENLRQDVFRSCEIGEAAIIGVGIGSIAIGKIAIIPALRPFGSRCIDLAAIESRALLGIPQQVVGGCNLLELLLGLLVAGIEIGVQLFCELPIGLLNLLLGGILLHAQRLVGIGGQHALPR